MEAFWTVITASIDPHRYDEKYFLGYENIHKEIRDRLVHEMAR